MKSLKTLFLSAVAVLTMASAANAQGAFSADWVSAYVWRGVAQSGPAIQPSLSYTMGGLVVGAWGSYSIGGGGTLENDFYAGYNLTIAEGQSVGIMVTDYYYPGTARLGYFDTDGKGAHTVEAALTYSGPVSVLAGFNFWNDVDNSIYVELGLPVAGDGINYNYFIGASNGGAFYAKPNTDFALINVGVSATKKVKLTEAFELPVKAVLGINPDAQTSFLTFGFTL